MSKKSNLYFQILFSPLSWKSSHTPAQHVSEAYEAHISQFKGATMTGLQELLTEVQTNSLHLQYRDPESGSGPEQQQQTV